MHTLSISQIFSNFSFYQDHYLTIIADPEQYFIPVAEAYIQIWPIGTQQLYLGDLLQLWLSEKWLVSHSRPSFLAAVTAGLPVQQGQDKPYIYQLSDSICSGGAYVKYHSEQAQHTWAVSWGSIYQYYWIYKSLSRPETRAVAPDKPLKPAISS